MTAQHFADMNPPSQNSAGERAQDQKPEVVAAMESYVYRYLFYVNEKEMFDALMKIKPTNAESLNRFFEIDQNEFEDAINDNFQIDPEDSLQLRQNKPEPRALVLRPEGQAAVQPQKTGSNSKSEEPARSNLGKRSIAFSMQL